MEILLEFKKQLVIFIDELIDQFPNEGDLIIIRLFISNQVSIKDLIENFILQINKDNQHFRKMIKDRNDTLFLEYNIFGKIFGNSKVSHFKKIWRSSSLDQEDKKIIWQWVDTFVYIADKYIKNI